jgi:formylglycine-generating enzyme required for sulfatase activity
MSDQFGTNPNQPQPPVPPPPMQPNAQVPGVPQYPMPPVPPPAYPPTVPPQYSSTTPPPVYPQGYGYGYPYPAPKKKNLTALWISLGAVALIAIVIVVLIVVHPFQTLDIGSTKVSPVDGMTMVYVPAGSFNMGSTSSSARYDDEIPQHSVNLDAFWIDKTEVTNKMYAQCVAVGACTEPMSAGSNYEYYYYGNPTFDDYPVIYVTWYQAQSYCEWAGRTLPTEAQWEKAARGTDGRSFPWGNETPSDYYVDLTSYAPHAVGTYPAGASPYGALDMVGNVFEWAADWYGETYYSESPSINPTGPSYGDRRILKGGGWGESGDYLYITIRWNNDPQFGYSDYNGFRCAMPAN